MQVRANILNAKFRFEPEEIWHDVSQSGKVSFSFALYQFYSIENAYLIAL